MLYSVLSFIAALIGLLGFFFLVFPYGKKGGFLNRYPFEGGPKPLFPMVSLGIGVLGHCLVYITVFALSPAGAFPILLSALVLLSGISYLAAFYFGFDKPVWHLRLAAAAFALNSAAAAGQGFYLMSLDALNVPNGYGVVLGAASFLLSALFLVPLLDRRILSSFRNTEIAVGEEKGYVRPRFEPMAFYERLYPAVLALSAALALAYALLMLA